MYKLADECRLKAKSGYKDGERWGNFVAKTAHGYISSYNLSDKSALDFLKAVKEGLIKEGLVKGDKKFSEGFEKRFFELLLLIKHYSDKIDKADKASVE